MRKTEDLILTIDVGTSGCKSALFRHDGTMVATATSSYHTYSPRPGWMEQKPADWWAAVVSSVREAVGRAGATKSNVIAISATGQMHGVVPLGTDGRVLGPYLTLHDQRAVHQANRIADDLGLSHVYGLTGARLAPGAPLAKIRWLREQQNHIFDATRFFLPCKDYINYLLSGEICTDPVEAAGALLFDIHKNSWCETLLDACGIRRDRLPPVRLPWDVIGPLRQSAAQELGLGKDTPVVVGAGDDIEFLGMGLVHPGMSQEHFGTTGSILACVDQPINDDTLSIELYPHLDPSLWLVGGSVSDAGGALSWASQTLYGNDKKKAWDVLRQYWKPRLDRPLLFLPYLKGSRCPIWNPDAKGGWLGLTVDHGPDDLVRAVAEGTVFSLRQVMEKIEALGVPITSIVVNGGKPDDTAWQKVRATIYGRQLQPVANPDPTCLGAMIVAGLAIRLFRDLQAGIDATVSLQKEILPDTHLAADYSRLYELYKEATDRCLPLFSSMAGLAREATRDQTVPEL